MRIITTSPRASHRPVAHRCGRWLMPGRASSTLKPNRHRTSNSISASRGKDSLTTIRSRSVGTARAMGHQSRIFGHSVGHGQYFRCNSGAVFTRRRHAVPESRLLTVPEYLRKSRWISYPSSGHSWSLIAPVAQHVRECRDVLGRIRAPCAAGRQRGGSMRHRFTGDEIGDEAIGPVEQASVGWRWRTGPVWGCV